MMKDDNRIHVCHLVYSFGIGGLERVIANCILSLDSKKYRHSIIALTEIGDSTYDVDDSVKIYSLFKREGHDTTIHFKLFKLLRKLKPNVLHTYNIATIEYQWIAALANIPLRVHAEHGRDTYDVDGSITKYKLLRRLSSLVTHRFIAVSQDLFDWLKHEVKIPESKLSLVVNGIDTQHYQPGHSLEEEMDFTAGKFVFGHISRLHSIKNQQMILQSFDDSCSISQSFNDNCILVFVGDGPDRSALENYVRDKKELKDKVFFVGSKNNVKDYYKIFDVFVMSSLAEGIPMTLLESMSMAVPHLVTSVGGINEVILNGSTGLAVESKDTNAFTEKMLEMHLERKQLSIMSENSRARIVDKFSQEVMIKAYDDIYQNFSIHKLSS